MVQASLSFFLICLIRFSPSCSDRQICEQMTRVNPWTWLILWQIPLFRFSTRPLLSYSIHLFPPLSVTSLYLLLRGAERGFSGPLCPPVRKQLIGVVTIIALTTVTGWIETNSLDSSATMAPWRTTGSAPDSVIGGELMDLMDQANLTVTEY